MTISRRNDWLGLIAFGLTYYLVAHIGMKLFSLQPSNITLIWLPSGIGLVMALKWGYNAIPFIQLPSFIVNLPGMLAGHSLANAVSYTFFASLIDTMMPMLAMLLMQRFMASGVKNAKDLLAFSICGCAIPVGLSSILLSLNLFVGSYIQAGDVASFAIMLFFADCLGVSLVYQVYATWLGQEQLVWCFNKRLASTVLSLLVIFIVGLSTRQWWLYYLVLPVLVLATFEIDHFSTAILSSLSMLVVILTTANGLGPFASSNPVETNAEMMTYVFSAALSIFGLSLQNSQLIRTEKDKVKAQEEAKIDPLTGLLNRRSFMPLLQQSIQVALEKGKPYSVAMLDIDHFKLVNDTYGHPTGDRVIKHLASVIKKIAVKKTCPPG